MAKLNHAQLTRITIRYDRAAEMCITLPAPPCGIEISPGVRSETTPCGPVIRSRAPRPARPRLHPLQVALRAMMGGEG
ncbi:MAG: hypothetical protein PHX82_15870 [Paracoccaceae bacterium]|nr:hypothetical protein [Paracoccaceae bacterium]